MVISSTQWRKERRQPMSDMLHVTDGSFEEEITKSELPVMVDFWAEWCGPCKMVGPVLEQLAGEYSGKVKIAKMDVDVNRQTPAKYGIRNIPTLIIFKGGEVVQTIIGAHPKSYIEEELKKVL
ncbi:MAG: thioredoxin [Deltaproteobacteria bacterium]|nr:thioredoxin [Deltaproteobacteria bacterium]